MKKEIIIDNLKCDGCSTRIIHQLKEINGVTDVIILNEENKVIVEIDNPDILEKVRVRLMEMGYPETGSIKGLKSLKAKGNSYASCMLGRIEKMNI